MTYRADLQQLKSDYPRWLHQWISFREVKEADMIGAGEAAVLRLARNHHPVLYVSD